jgi:hypothetical protein
MFYKAQEGIMWKINVGQQLTSTDKRASQAYKIWPMTLQKNRE